MYSDSLEYTLAISGHVVALSTIVRALSFKATFFWSLVKLIFHGPIISRRTVWKVGTVRGSLMMGTLPYFLTPVIFISYREPTFNVTLDIGYCTCPIEMKPYNRSSVFCSRVLDIVIDPEILVQVRPRNTILYHPEPEPVLDLFRVWPRANSRRPVRT